MDYQGSGFPAIQNSITPIVQNIIIPKQQKKAPVKTGAIKKEMGRSKEVRKGRRVFRKPASGLLCVSHLSEVRIVSHLLKFIKIKFVRYIWQDVCHK